MTALAKVESQPTLEDLAATANREHTLVTQSVLAALEHAVLAGEALLAAKQLVPFGEWGRWLASNWAYTHVTACDYMRLATHQDMVRASDVTSVNQAKLLLQAHGVEESAHIGTKELRAEAMRLVSEEGMTRTEAGAVLGVDRHSVSRWVNPERVEKERARKQAERKLRIAERQALKRQQRDEAVRRVGGPKAKAYSLVRQALQSLEQAHAEATDREERAAISVAMNALYRAEDAVATASKLS